MEKQVCPFDHKTPCVYLIDDRTLVHNCDFCEVYQKTHKKDDDPLDGTKMLGCLGAGLIGLILFGVVVIGIINYVRQL